MKKCVLVLAGLIVFAVINAQSLNEIVKKYGEAKKLDKIAAISTIKISARMSVSGMDLPMELWMKNPDKIKTVTSINGQDIVTVIDGTKGYTINPMAGSTDPVEMTADQIKQSQNVNLFKNALVSYLKEGKLTLQGEENVNDKPAFKLKADLDGGNSAIMYIDKASYFLVKSTATVNQNGTEMQVESYPSEYKDINGILLPMKTTTTTQGMEFTLVYDKVETNVPMNDSIFKIK